MLVCLFFLIEVYIVFVVISNQKHLFICRYLASGFISSLCIFVIVSFLLWHQPLNMYLILLILFSDTPQNFNMDATDTTLSHLIYCTSKSGQLCLSYTPHQLDCLYVKNPVSFSRFVLPLVTCLAI